MVVKKRYIVIGLILVIVILVTVIASSMPFRPYPTHNIVKQINCFSCHIDEFEDLKSGDHIRMMRKTQNKTLYDYLGLYWDNSTIKNAIDSVEGPCYSCHMTYAKFNLFGLTDPFAYKIGEKTYILDNQTNTVNITDAQYGYIIDWPAGNRSITYFGNDNVSLQIELTVLDVSPVNLTVDTVIKVIFANYSGQQGNNTVLDFNAVLGKGDTTTINITNFSEDYFKILLILDGLWNNTLINVKVNGTDKGLESFFIIADYHPFVYELPLNASGIYYFKTPGIYKAVRLDYVLGEWVNYAMSNITTSEIVETNSSNSSIGWINASSCSSPDGMCHINQKTTYMGLSNNLNKSFYTHQLAYTTSSQCEICHLNNKILVSFSRSTIPPTPIVIPTTTITPTPTTTITPTPTSDYVPLGYSKVFEDQFTGTLLDTSIWSISEGNGYSIQDGNLLVDNALLGTIPMWKYGYIVFRAKVTNANNKKGWISQLWMSSVGTNAETVREFDLLEIDTGPMNNNRDPCGVNKANNAYLWQYNPTTGSWNHYNGDNIQDVDLSKDYHIYSVEWTPDSIKFFLDGKVTFIPSGMPDYANNVQGEKLRIGAWRGGFPADRCGQESGSLVSPLMVDYVRVYQKS